MAPKETYDVVVIGGGPGGYVAAIRASQLGLKAACIEFRGALGGTCLNVGCIPSKALLESSEMYEKISKHAEDYGVKVGKVSPDVKAMIARKSAIVSKFTKGIEGLFKKNKVTYLKGMGSFVGPNEISVKDKNGETTVGAKHVIIATGSDPIEIPIAKFDKKVVVSSTEALEFDEIPEHLIVVGGGVIGLEMGSVWRRLGAKVTIIEALPSILANMDEAVSKGMTKIMEAQGMEIHANTKVMEVKVSGSKAKVKAECDGKTKEFSGDKVLIAVGRRAYTNGLGLEKVGIQAKPNGKIVVNEHLQTSLPHVYAIGDVIDGLMLAHKAEEEGVAVAEMIAGKPGHVNYKAIPNIIYTWPEVASVGLSEKECKDKGIQYNVGQFPFIANGRAACLGTTDGFVKIIADKTTDQMLGVHMIGPNASELIAEVAIAFEFNASAEDIARSVHAHPTLAEVMWDPLESTCRHASLSIL